MTDDKKQLQLDQKENPASLSEKGIIFLVMVIVLLTDHFSKRAIETSLHPYHSWTPFPAIEGLFKITHVTNTGAAFGLFPDGSLVFAVIAVVVSVVIVIFNFGLPANYFIFRIALGLQLGGALGNLINRLRLGHVTDIFNVGPWPVFNIADLSIVVGVILLGLLMIIEQRNENMESKNQTVSIEADSRGSGEVDDVNMHWNE